MLNPQGFRHAPGSKHGCVLFVKLRQYGGDRQHLRIETDQMPWKRTQWHGIQEKLLLPGPERISLLQCQRDSWLDINADKVTEVFVIEGQVKAEDASFTLSEWSWVRLPIGDAVRLRAEENSVVYFRIGEWRQD